MRKMMRWSKSKEGWDSSITVGELFKLITECPSKSVLAVVERSVPILINIVNKYNYKTSTDLYRQLTLILWSSMSLVSLMVVEIKVKVDNFETELMKNKVEREHERILNTIISHYSNNDTFLRDYLAFISIADLWDNCSVFNQLLNYIPPDRIYVDEFVTNICKIIVDQYWKKESIVLKNILSVTSLLMLQQEWISTSYGSLKCIEYLLQVFESVYKEEDAYQLDLVNIILKWMRYFVERMSQPEHIADLMELLSVWLYFHGEDVHQVVDIGSLIFLCCDLYHPITFQMSLKHFFQNVVLCMINSNDLSTVSIGYDIVISITDRFDNKDVLSKPKIFGPGDLHTLKRRTRQSIGETLFSREDFTHLTDSIHKVVLNSINKFTTSKILARKVNTLVSLMAIEGCDSAQGLMSVISISLSVQENMLQMSKRNSRTFSITEDVPHPDRSVMRYHACVASWLTLLGFINTGDLDVLRNYVKSVTDLRLDSAPYLLPSQEHISFLPYYIYELDKNLYFDIDRIRSAIENSWVILTNNRSLLGNIKIPRSNQLVEKYIDLQMLDYFDTYKSEDKVTPENSEEFKMDEVVTLFTDVENRYSEAFTEPFDRFIFYGSISSSSNY